MGQDNLKVGSDQPLDDIAANLMETIARKGRGFILALAKDSEGKVEIEVKESLKLHDEWRPTADYRAHKLETADSFIRYATKYGDIEKSLVFFHETGCALVIDETVEKGSREVVTLTLPTSQGWRDWSNVLGEELEHKTLLEFLLQHEDHLSDPSVLLAMTSVKTTSTVNYESDIQDFSKDVGVMFKTNAGEELKRFPKTFLINLPILESDEGAGVRNKAEMRLQIAMPDGPNEKPGFTLYCAPWRTILKQRIEAAGEQIAAELEGWTVVHGLYQTKPHELK